MAALVKVTVVESRLFLRDVANAFFAVALPSLILVILGAIPALRTPDETFGGQRFVDFFVPSLVVITLATLGVNTMPVRLATYREKGILRRLSTTPVNPANLLIAQLLINGVAAIVAVVLLVLIGRLVFDIPLPQHPLGFVAVFIAGGASLFALGLVAAAVAPTARSSAAVALPIFFVSMFFGGVYLPRFLLPEFLVRIGDYVPPGVQALQDAWTGTGPEPLQLVIMAAIAVAASVVAARLFRWE
ncbi:ABC transporter permease [Actinopolymorpha alba]|uniref:ABC transporter permease n=1 Tax=Actinopolymorpha alba TaxID=533267 RepID=UPI0003639515|nr:ABC transporter permease [Actinopolymorpha alba]